MPWFNLFATIIVLFIILPTSPPPLLNITNIFAVDFILLLFKFVSINYISYNFLLQFALF